MTMVKLVKSNVSVKWDKQSWGKERRRIRREIPLRRI